MRDVISRLKRPSSTQGEGNPWEALNRGVTVRFVRFLKFELTVGQRKARGQGSIETESTGESLFQDLDQRCCGPDPGSDGENRERDGFKRLSQSKNDRT